MFSYYIRSTTEVVVDDEHGDVDTRPLNVFVCLPNKPSKKCGIPYRVI